MAPSETGEALAIAIALREAVELGHTPAALVTTDRTLARRVSAELERFGIFADDSGGMPLEQTPPATLFLLMLGLAFDQLDPASLLSLFAASAFRLRQRQAGGTPGGGSGGPDPVARRNPAAKRGCHSSTSALAAKRWITR